ncbi:MAG TPA: restriction endonuclease subunit S [Parasutterella excrementihominis]|uniref:restriction endonuclease subunit S n=1 Tax=Parasutterella TaxID=577310 RepID=UPI000EE0B904|nr:restriction endonuclease subunit S [Parasutterella excrementihominis]HAI62099.1 restriction endonuclease subunit S [Parasutterella excrementihominis]HBZ28808.1 restriction endonuclease subunit S [Parasutterella excrementihominis]
MNQNKSVKIRFKGFTEAWEQRELNTAATFLNGRAFSQSELLSKGEYPVLRVGNFYTNDKWYFSDLVLPEKFYANKGDLLYTWSATFGPHIWEGDKVIYHYHIWKLLLGKDTDKTFLLSLLQRDRETLLHGSNGSTMIHITKQAMEAKKLFFPRSQEEQRQIGSFFKTIDKAITLHQRKLNRFQKIRTTFLQKMFPKNGETKPAIRLTGFNADWEQEKLQNFAVRITRKNIKKQNNRPLTISAQHGLVDQTVYFNNRVAAQDVSNYYLIKKGEFAYNRSTSKDAPVGAVRRLVDYEEGVLSTLYLVFSITDPQHVDPNYLSYFFETTGWHSWILERAAEGARNHGLLNVSSQDFLSLPVMLPSSLEEQQKIGEFFQKIDDCIILLERQADLLKQIKSSLLLSMFPPSNAE